MKGRHSKMMSKLRTTLPVRKWVAKFEKQENRGCWNSDMASYGWPRVLTDRRPSEEETVKMADFCREHFGDDNFAYMMAAFYFTTEDQAITFKLCNSELL